MQRLPIRKKIEDGKQHEPIIAVIVDSGAQKKTFYVRKELLAKHSQFFASIVKDDCKWKEGQTGLVELGCDNSVTFEVFYQFIYTGKICTQKDGDASRHPQTDVRMDEEWTRLRDCWIMGEKLLSTSFKDAITDATIEKATNSYRFPATMHQGIFASSAGPCGMRKLLVDTAVWEWSDEAMSARIWDSSYAQFFIDVATRFNQFKSEPLPSAPFRSGPESCRLYHDHGKNTPCYRAMSWTTK